MSDTEKREIGDVGENAVADRLINTGHIILDRNYLKPWGELDIVSKYKDCIHFIEVKTVTRVTGSPGDYEAFENIHKWKRKRLSRIIQTYLLDKRIGDSEWQIDAYSVALDSQGKVITIECLEDIML